MRAGPLSRPEVIDLLNRHFVPVFVVNEDHREGGPAPEAERSLMDRIRREALAAGLSSGSVHAYVVAPDGHPTDSLHVAEAAKDETLLAMLRRAVAAFSEAHAGPILEPRSLSRPPEAPAGSVVLHLTARGRGNSWGGFPSENWIVLDADAARGLRPPGEEPVEPGRRWEVPEPVATAIFTHFYPQTENNDVSTHRFSDRSLRGEVVAVSGGVARARLTGTWAMTHPFYPGREDGNVARGEVVGTLEWDVATGQVRKFLLVTDGASYGRGGLDVAVRRHE
jgi:hypothetical protein